eukprot:6026325-Amphidinium_carterae.1
MDGPGWLQDVAMSVATVKQHNKVSKQFCTSNSNCFCNDLAIARTPMHPQSRSSWFRLCLLLP